MKEPMKQARSGDPKAIQQLIQDRLSNPTLNVRVSLRKGKLQVAIVSREQIEEVRVVNATKAVIEQIAFMPGLLTSAKVICIEEVPQMDSASSTTTGTVIQWSTEFEVGPGKTENPLVQTLKSEQKRLGILLGGLVVTTLLGGGAFFLTQPNPDQVAKNYVTGLSGAKSTHLLCTEGREFPHKIVAFDLKAKQQSNPLTLVKRGDKGQVSSFSAELHQLAVYVPTMGPKIRQLATRSVSHVQYTYSIRSSESSSSVPLVFSLWKTSHLRQLQVEVTQLLKAAEPLRQACNQQPKTEQCKKIARIYQSLESLSDVLSLPLSWQEFAILPKPLKSTQAFCVAP